MHSRRLLALIVVLFGVILCQVSSLPASAAESPSALVATVLKAASAQKAVHYAASISNGAVTVRQAADVGASVGIQRITYTKSGRTGHVTVLLVGGTAYLQGDAFALTNYNEFPPAIANKYANVWLRVPRTYGAYANIVQGASLGTTIAQLEITGTVVALAPTIVDGQRVVGVEGTAKTAGHPVTTMKLLARAIGSPLPVEESMVSGSAHASVAFSDWNEHVGVSSPPRSVSIASIGLT
jgi:hypothetical protein